VHNTQPKGRPDAWSIVISCGVLLMYTSLRTLNHYWDGTNSYVPAMFFLVLALRLTRRTFRFLLTSPAV
jgi:hypothetical protein